VQPIVWVGDRPHVDRGPGVVAAAHRRAERHRQVAEPIGAAPPDRLDRPTGHPRVGDAGPGHLDLRLDQVERADDPDGLTRRSQLDGRRADPPVLARRPLEGRAVDLKVAVAPARGIAEARVDDREGAEQFAVAVGNFEKDYGVPAERQDPGPWSELRIVTSAALKAQRDPRRLGLRVFDIRWYPE